MKEAPDRGVKGPVLTCRLAAARDLRFVPCGGQNRAAATFMSPGEVFTMPKSTSRRSRMFAGLALGVGLFVSQAAAQYEGYYTEPDIANGTIVFCAEGDLWTVSEAGGVATRLTSAAGDESQPRISPDGKSVAFSASYDGNRDVYVVPITGGEPVRLTWHPFSDAPTAWSPDGKYVYYHTGRDTGFYNRRTWKVAATGGPSELVPAGVSCFMDVDADGDTVVFNRNYTQPRTWKRYGGGTADDLWLGSLAKQNIEKVTSYFGQDQSPIFMGERIFFMSERDGRMNLWSIKKKGGDLKQHTTKTDFDVKMLQGDGKTKLVYQHGADIELFDTEKNSGAKVAIKLQGDRPGTREKFASASSYIENGSLSEDGKKVIVTARGDMFNVPIKSGRAISLSATSSTRERGAEFAGADDEWVVYISDKSGTEEIYRRNARTGEGEEAISSPGDARKGKYHYALAIAPDGNRLAFGDEAGSVYWSDMTSKTMTLIDDSDTWELRDYDWSPDSRYLAYSKTEPNEYNRIYIYDTKENKTVPVTDPFFSSYNPTWDPEGKYLFFISERSYRGWGDRVDYEVIMAEMDRPYALILQADGKNPFATTDPYEEDDEKKAKEEKEKKEKEEKEKKDKEKKDEAKDEDKADESEDGDKKEVASKMKADEDSEEKSDDDKKGEGKGGDKKDGDKKKKPEPVKIDFDGLMDRIFVLPGAPQDINGMVAVKGRVYFNSRGQGGRDAGFYSPEKGERSSLKYFTFTGDKKEEKTWGTGIDTYGFTRNREHMWYRKDGAIKVASASSAAPGNDDKAAALDGVTMHVTPREEWEQILEEAYRLNRDFFYMKNMTNVNWREITDRYKTLLPRLSNRSDLNDVIGNLIGELGHGHTYVWSPGDVDGGGRGVGVGLLGAELISDTKAGTVQFGEILPGDRWSMDTLAPLVRPKVDVKKGEYLLAVDGEKVSGDRDPFSYFWGKSGKDVTITVNDKPTMEGARTYRVTTISNDSDLWYRHQVETNRAYVSKMSNDEIGYIHIPDMGGPGLIAFFRDWYPQLRKKALVVDVRHNGGGNVSQLLLNRLRRIAFSFGKTANFDDQGTYPSKVFTGPMACIINQNAGSDGDIFPYNFSKAKLGPLIGVRSWGGVVGIRSDKSFMDNGKITIPEFADYDAKNGWYIENYGVDPDKGFEVEMMPADYVMNRDPQLDKAIEYLKDEMKKKEYQKPPMPPAPDRSTEAFRKRSEGFMKKP